jgi:acyl-CoA dehydrogenase
MHAEFFYFPFMKTTEAPKKSLDKKNKILSVNYSPSANFYHSDLIWQNYLQNKISKEGKNYMEDKWQVMGQRAAKEMDALSMDADKNRPELIKRNFWGEDRDEIKFHPSYHRLMDFAVESEMFRVKWEPALRQKFRGELHQLGFGSGYLYAMSEMGQYCPLCMTDGVARLIDRFCTEEDKDRLLPHIAATNIDELYTGAMFLTEKVGGSDVGANIVTARRWRDDYYLLNGEKWFCSNANAEIIFALARTKPEIQGTKGLSIFMIEKNHPDGGVNELGMIRLKDKLGVRSMASAECRMNNTVGKLVGEEFKGFKIMTEMINLSRLYNSVAALSASRRALIEAYQFLSCRNTFGKNALQHVLIREKLFELGSMHVANFYMTWKAIATLDQADNGDENAKELVRMLTPMVKKWTAEKGTYMVRESMELMGGIGYIEDGVMPKIMRDIMVLPIWEGAGNIMTLDMLRAAQKSKGLEVMLSEIKTQAENNTEYGPFIDKSLSGLVQKVKQLNKLDLDSMQLLAEDAFEQLTRVYQMSVLIENLSAESEAWILPALGFLKEKVSGKKERTTTLSVDEVKGLLAWDF